MSHKIQELIDSEVNRVSHVVGHGPSLSRYSDDLLRLDKENEMIVSVNSVDEMTKLEPDYWVTANTEYLIPLAYKRINKFPNTTFIYSDAIDQTPVAGIDKILDVKYYSFDHKHFKCQPNLHFVHGRLFGCTHQFKNHQWPGMKYVKWPDLGLIDCCKAIIPGRLTLQELLQKHSGFHFHYSTGDTCILHALAISILMGSKEIHIYGVDLDYSRGYVGKHLTDNFGAVHRDSFDFWMRRLLSDFYIQYMSAKKLGIKIHYHGDCIYLRKIFNGEMIPRTVYPSDCLDYK